MCEANSWIIHMLTHGLETCIVITLKSINDPCNTMLRNPVLRQAGRQARLAGRRNTGEFRNFQSWL